MRKKTKYTGVYEQLSVRKKYKGKPDSCIYIAYKLSGKLKWEKIGWKSEGYTPVLAAEIRGQRMKDIRHGRQVKTQAEINKEKRMHNKPLGEVKEHYFESERGKSLKGRKTDLNRWEKHLAYLNRKTIAEITELDIAQIKKSMRRHKPATISNTLELLRRIINYGVKCNLCPPLSFSIQMPRVDNVKTEYLTDEQAQRLIEVLNGWSRQDVSRMVKLAMFSGLRRGEIFKLKRKNIDFSHNLLILENPKSGRTETVPLNRITADLLKEQLVWVEQHYPDSLFVFPGKGGKQRVDCSAIKRIKKAAGLPVSFRPFHGLRHHYAVMLASSGEFTLDMIGKLLTHKDTAITQRYAHFLPEAQKKAANKAAEILMQQMTQSEVVPFDDKARG